MYLRRYRPQELQMKQGGTLGSWLKIFCATLGRHTLRLDTPDEGAPRQEESKARELDNRRHSSH